MEITLLVSPGGTITFHCDFPFVHKLISLQEIEKEIQNLIDQQILEENFQDEKDDEEAFLAALEKADEEKERFEKERSFGL